MRGQPTPPLGRRRARPFRGVAPLLGTAVLLSVSGCTSLQAPAETLGNRFYAAVGGSDWTTACAMLAPKTRAQLEQNAGTGCATALPGQHLSDGGPAAGFAGYGGMAQVRYPKDTVFLARFPDGWKVYAAGCTPVHHQPYDCRLQG